MEYGERGVATDADCDFEGAQVDERSRSGLRWVICQPGAEWVCEWAHAGGRWRVDYGWKLAEFTDEEAIAAIRRETISPTISSSHHFGVGPRDTFAMVNEAHCKRATYEFFMGFV